MFPQYVAQVEVAGKRYAIKPFEAKDLNRNEPTIHD